MVQVSYALVNVYITMENPHVYWETPYINGHLFHSYVELQYKIHGIRCWMTGPGIGTSFFEGRKLAGTIYGFSFKGTRC